MHGERSTVHQRHDGVRPVSLAASKDAAPGSTALDRSPWLRWMTVYAHRRTLVIAKRRQPSAAVPGIDAMHTVRWYPGRMNRRDDPSPQNPSRGLHNDLPVPLPCQPMPGLSGQRTHLDRSREPTVLSDARSPFALGGAEQ